MRCCGKATWTVVDAELGNMGQACFECGAVFPIPKYDDCDGRGKMYLCWKDQARGLRTRYGKEPVLFKPDLSNLPPSLEETMAKQGKVMGSTRRYGKRNKERGVK